MAMQTSMPMPPTFPERPRERCLTAGPQALSLRECLAVLLGTAPRGAGGALGLAQRMLDQPGPGLSPDDAEAAFFHALESCRADVLKPVPGLGPAARARVLAALELGKRYAQFRARGPGATSTPAPNAEARSSLARIPAEARWEAREWLGFVPRYRSGRWGGLCRVEEGVRTHVQVDPTELFARVLALRPEGFVLAHNHPSGRLDASSQDLELTRLVAAAGAAVGVRLAGHWIVAPEGELWIPPFAPLALARAPR
ncbi:MAG: hypothetical protein IT285_08240 [Bdellovibrionales bacterium]|nr:hypothetical protein [Bdellovibrionales bacterium]